MILRDIFRNPNFVNNQIFIGGESMIRSNSGRFFPPFIFEQTRFASASSVSIGELKTKPKDLFPWKSTLRQSDLSLFLILIAGIGEIFLLSHFDSRIDDLKEEIAPSQDRIKESISTFEKRIGAKIDAFNEKLVKRL